MNRELLEVWKLDNPDLCRLNIQGNKLILNGQILVLGDFNLNSLVTNDHFNRDRSDLSAEQIFDLVKVEVIASEMSKEKTVSEQFEEEQKKNPNLQGIKIINRKDSFGIEKNYLYYLDQDNVDHILYLDINVDLKRTLHELSTQLEDYTAKDLFDYYQRKVYEIQLNDSKEQESLTNETPQRALNEFRNLDRENYNQRKSVVGNVEHGIYVSAPEEVVTFSTGSKGEMIKESYAHDSLESDVSNNALEQNETNEVQKEVMTNLISREEFYHLLNQDNAYTSKNNQELELFYAFLGDLIIYRDYLSPDLVLILNEYLNYIEQLELKNEKNANQEEALKRFHEINTKSQEAVISQRKEETSRLVLERAPEESAGNIKLLFLILLILSLTILVGIGIAIKMVA